MAKKISTRLRQSISVIGKKKSGKSTETLKMVYEAIAKYPKDKALFIDINDEYGNFQYFDKAISIDTVDVNDIFSMKPGQIRRVVPFKGKNSPPIKNLAAWVQKIVDDFSGGYLILEDVSKYLNKGSMYFDKNIKSILEDRLLAYYRAKDVSPILHFQSFETLFIKNKLIAWRTNILRIHKTIDIPSLDAIILTIARMVLSKYEGDQQQAYIDELIKEHGFKKAMDMTHSFPPFYGSLCVDFDNRKILGEHSEKIMMGAIDYVIDQEIRSIVVEKIKEYRKFF